MKFVYFVGLLFFSLLSFSQDEITENLPKIEFKTKVHDFGEIPYNSKAEYDFVFKNIGKGPLIIKNAKAS